MRIHQLLDCGDAVWIDLQNVLESRDLFFVALSRAKDLRLVEPELWHEGEESRGFLGESEGTIDLVELAELRDQGRPHLPEIRP